MFVLYFYETGIIVKMDRILQNVYKATFWLGLVPSILEARAALVAFCRVTDTRLQR